jgi:thiamine-phosphate pyrophosphorylase
MVEAGLRIIQLRMKDVPAHDVRRTAEKLRKIIPPEVAFIVNDDPAIARDTGADGVHLGQGDMPYPQARALLGNEAIIGLSTHNPQQTRDACALLPDYIGVGPVFATPTKKIPDPDIGLDGMAAMLAVATVPAVCLGGIDHSNVRAVLEAGARNICAVRCINASATPRQEIARLQEEMRRFS